MRVGEEEVYVYLEIIMNRDSRFENLITTFAKHLTKAEIAFNPLDKVLFNHFIVSLIGYFSFNQEKLL